MPVMFRLQYFEGEKKWCPFQDDIYIFQLIFLYHLIFSNLTSVRFQTSIRKSIVLSYHFIIKRLAQDDVITWKRFP